ncbi:uncharacterized protein CPUR_04935 [Claviceps purpurea 20.1]|uniref:Uncharacterized protein n=1 Tax=Claviceps purpurea (strain 20.1) TaxID=1111077 RepID=M1WFP0_CLAP2|nr:uncharacterized protein CPUR_04935 [Claviceps purpurea 20.1]
MYSASSPAEGYPLENLENLGTNGPTIANWRGRRRSKRPQLAFCNNARQVIMSGDDELQRLLRAVAGCCGLLKRMLKLLKRVSLKSDICAKPLKSVFALLKSYQNSHVTFLHAVYSTMN